MAFTVKLCLTKEVQSMLCVINTISQTVTLSLLKAHVKVDLTNYAINKERVLKHYSG